MFNAVLDTLQLPLVQEITTLDQRALAEHKPPGMAGSLVQNLGRRPMRVSLWGVTLGDGAQDFAGKLDDLFRRAKPVPFSADITADARLDLVIVEDLTLKELAGTPLRISYVLTLREFMRPVDPKPVTAIDPAIAGDALARVGNIVGGLDAARGLVSGLEQFLPRFGDLLTKLRAAAKP